MSKKGVVLEGRAREIVSKVDKYFQNERKHSNALAAQLKMADFCTQESRRSDGNICLSRELYCSLVNYMQDAKKATERVCAATGLSKVTVTRIRKEAIVAESTGGKLETPKKKPRGKFIVYGKSEIAALQEVIKSLLAKKEIPSYNKIYAIARKDLNFPGSKSTFRRIMAESMGYKFKNCHSDKLAHMQSLELFVAPGREDRSGVGDDDNTGSDGLKLTTAEVKVENTLMDYSGEGNDDNTGSDGLKLTTVEVKVENTLSDYSGEGNDDNTGSDGQKLTTVEVKFEKQN